MTHENLLRRISVDPRVAGGKPVIRGTRIYVATVLGGLSEGLTPEEIIDHFPALTKNDICAALAYAAELAQENVFKVA
jgi:uncharacterized protein (DUF433 family)